VEGLNLKLVAGLGFVGELTLVEGLVEVAGLTGAEGSELLEGSTLGVRSEFVDSAWTVEGSVVELFMEVEPSI